MDGCGGWRGEEAPGGRRESRRDVGGGGGGFAPAPRAGECQLWTPNPSSPLLSQQRQWEPTGTVISALLPEGEGCRERGGVTARDRASRKALWGVWGPGDD